MTFWKNISADRTGPAYQRVADAIHAAIVNGTLAPGTRLPPQRQLSHDMGVSIGTITRAYNLAIRRGDVHAVIGRGTFVKGTNDDESAGAANLRINLPADIGQGVDLAEAMAARRADEFLTYIPFGGSPDHHAAARTYLKIGGVENLTHEIIVTAGGQHALTTALLAATQAGDLILCEPFTFGGFLDIAQAAGRRVMTIPSDHAGIKPNAFQELCRKHAPAAAFLMPTAQNPTGTTLSLKRRNAIVKSARANKVILIEDGLYDPFAETPLPPLVSLAPESTFYIASLSKTLAPGLRVGYLACPPDFHSTANDLQHLLGMGPPLAMANIATDLINSGAVSRLVAAQRNEIKWRHQAATEALISARPQIKEAAPHLWVPLPTPWTAEAFVDVAEREGVLVSPASHFSPDQKSPFIRLALGAAENRKTLTNCLTILKNLMTQKSPRTGRSL